MRVIRSVLFELKPFAVFRLRPEEGYLTFF